MTASDPLEEGPVDVLPSSSSSDHGSVNATADDATNQCTATLQRRRQETSAPPAMPKLPFPQLGFDEFDAFIVAAFQVYTGVMDFACTLCSFFLVTLPFALFIEPMLFAGSYVRSNVERAVRLVECRHNALPPFRRFCFWLPVMCYSLHLGRDAVTYLFYSLAAAFECRYWHALLFGFVWVAWALWTVTATRFVCAACEELS